MNNEFFQNLGINLKNARHNAGLTMQKIMDDTGISTTTLVKYERGFDKPQLDILYQLSELYHVSLEELFTGKIEFIPFDEDEIDRLHSENYYRELLNAIFENDEAGQFVSEDVSDLGGSIEYVLSTALSPRERFITVSLYCHGKTLQETGDYFCVSRERIRQIAERAVTKMRSAENKSILLYGIKKNNQNKAVDAFSDGYKKGFIDGFEEAKNKATSAFSMRPTEIATDLSNSDISVLNLSTRSYNQLSSNGISTVGELLKLSTNELKTMKNIGLVSIMDIEKKLKNFGLALS